VSYLDEDSARELIVQPVEDFPDIYERTAIDTIIHLTRCQPYLVQLTCYEVVELSGKTGEMPVPQKPLHKMSRQLFPPC